MHKFLRKIQSLIETLTPLIETLIQWGKIIILAFITGILFCAFVLLIFSFTLTHF